MDGSGAAAMKLILRLAAVSAVMASGLTPCLAVGERAQAELKGADGHDAGSIKMIETTAGVLLRIKLKGLTPGPHGLHIHETGDVRVNAEVHMGCLEELFQSPVEILGWSN